MGIRELWKTVEPAAQEISLKELTLEHALNNPSRPYRIGVDVSLWMHQMQHKLAVGHANSGPNPELRTIFYRLASYLNLAVHLVFVEDGPQRPLTKRNVKVLKNGHWLVSSVRQFAEAFGFTWHCAPGEAEAELARMNSLGVIDSVLTDDSDVLVFGVKTVMRNPECTGKRNPDMRLVRYQTDSMVMQQLFRTLPGDLADYQPRDLQSAFLMYALLVGSDYDPRGLKGCGSTTAYGISRYLELGDCLKRFFQSGTRHRKNDQALSDALDQWTEQLRQALADDPLRYVGRKRAGLAAALFESPFPKTRAVNGFLHPVVSSNKHLLETFGRTRFREGMRFSNTLIYILQELCEETFQWTPEIIAVKFDMVGIWEGLVLRRVLDETMARRRDGNVLLINPASDVLPPPALKTICGRFHMQFGIKNVIADVWNPPTTTVWIPLAAAEKVEAGLIAEALDYCPLGQPVFSVVSHHEWADLVTQATSGSSSGALAASSSSGGLGLGSASQDEPDSGEPAHTALQATSMSDVIDLTGDSD